MPTETHSKIRVVVAKPGLDGHDAARRSSRRRCAMRAMEVIYTGLHQTPEPDRRDGDQEDADAVGCRSCRAPT